EPAEAEFLNVSGAYLRERREALCVVGTSVSQPRCLVTGGRQQRVAIHRTTRTGAGQEYGRDKNEREPVPRLSPQADACLGHGHATPASCKCCIPSAQSAGQASARITV